MSRRLGRLGIIMLVLFALLIGQSAYLQFWHKATLDALPLNPRNSNLSQVLPRGDIIGGDGLRLAYSVPSGVKDYPWKRVYPFGSLTSGVVGFAANYYGNWGLESWYDSDLLAHSLPAQSWTQVLAPATGSNTLSITLLPTLQRVAQNALANRDGAVVAIDPRNGAILAMYSNPSFNPTRMTLGTQPSEAAAWKIYTGYDGHHFQPLGMLATQQTFPPGSTFKVVTTVAAVVHKPELLTKSYPLIICTALPTSNKTLCNDGGQKCGGMITVMLPQSCDPGYALLGLDVGGSYMAAAANSFGYNSAIPIDFPGVANSYFPASSVFNGDQPQLAYSAIGQENVRATALQNALVAAGIANGGAIMQPHFLTSITDSEGRIVTSYVPRVWKRPLTAAQTLKIVPLMQDVVRIGTASGVGFLPQDDVAAKTGTAQTGNSQQNTDDWMIAFAPATHPVIAIAVVVPYQAITAYGATVAGPIVKCMVEAAIALSQGRPATNTATTCPK